MLRIWIKQKKTLRKQSQLRRNSLLKELQEMLLMLKVKKLMRRKRKLKLSIVICSSLWIALDLCLLTLTCAELSSS